MGGDTPMAGLDPGLIDYLAAAEALDPPDRPPGDWPEERRRYAALCRHFAQPAPAGLTVADARIGPVGVRWYRPAAPRSGAVAVFLHGGGWVVGDLDTHDSIVADLAAASGVAMLAVDYRLAPEHPYPAALDDAWAVLCRVAAEADRIVLVGDSAGGNLAAALTLKARAAGGPGVAGQVLIYPALGTDAARPAYRDRAAAPVLTTEAMIGYWRLYCGFPAPDPLAAPLLAADLTGLPPAFLVACEFDPLRDDAVDYADRLAAAGVAATLRREPALCHGYLRARGMSRAAAASFAAIAEATAGFAGAATPASPC